MTVESEARILQKKKQKPIIQATGKLHAVASAKMSICRQAIDTRLQHGSQIKIQFINVGDETRTAHTSLDSSLKLD